MKSWIVEGEPQGSPQWKAGRKSRCNASDLACAMGIDPNGRKRSDLIREMATGIEREFSDYVKNNVIDPGHEIEKLARAIIERRFDQEMYPVVMAGEADGILLGTSLDGINMAGWLTFECKRKNADLWQSVSGGVIPKGYHPQMEQGLWISGAEVCLFSVSDGTEDGTISCEYRSDPELRAKIIPTWRQLLADLAAYRPEDDVIPAPAVAASHEGLPAVTIQAFGSIDIRDNLSAFGDALSTYLERMPKKPATDEDFATLEDAVKRLKAAEEALDAAENGALAQASSIDDMRRQVERWRSLARDNRLAFEKLVKSEKENRKAALVNAARDALLKHVAELTQRVGGYLPAISCDWAGPIKGLKTLASIKDKLDGELARAKIDANQIAQIIAINRDALMDGAQDWNFLFPDFRQCCTKAPEDFANLLMHRINEHTQREEAKLEAERERIRQEEAAKLAQEQRGKTPEATHAAQSMPAQPQAPAAGTPPTDDGRRIKLGELKAILAPISIDAEGLAQLGIHPVGHEKAAKLYRAGDVPAICRAIIRHMSAIAETHF